MSKTGEQGQKQLKPNKLVTILALSAAIAAAVAAIFSSCTASKALSHIKSVNRSQISIQRTEPTIKRAKTNEAQLRIRYLFKIVGQEPVEILNMKIGRFMRL